MSYNVRCEIPPLSLTLPPFAAWPVPDVYEALIKAFTGAGKTVEEAQAHIEELKEEERYILEVYVRVRFFPLVVPFAHFCQCTHSY